MFGFVFFVGSGLDLVVKVDDDRSDDRHHHDAVYAQKHAQQPPDQGRRRDVAEADRRDDGEAIPQGVRKGVDIGLHRGDRHRKSDDEQQQSEQDLSRIRLAHDLAHKVQVEIGKGQTRDVEQTNDD